MSQQHSQSRRLFLQILLGVGIFVTYEMAIYYNSDFGRPTSTSFFHSNSLFQTQLSFIRTTPTSTAVPGTSSTASNRSKKIVLFWNTFWSAPDIFAVQGEALFRGCPVSNCIPSMNHADLNQSSAVLFHPADFNLNNLPPPPRDVEKYYIFYYLESPGSVDLSPSYPRWNELRNYFNLTMTFRRDSDVFLREYFNHYTPHVCERRNHTKSALWLVSHCTTYNGRERYAKELAKFMQVDTFGKCGNDSKKLGTGFEKEYMFYLAFENTNCKDYVTEKLMFALNNDLIPIVYGGANYTALLPAGSFINVEDFDSPQDLAAHLMNISSNSSLFDSFHTWKKMEWNFPGVPSKEMASWCQICEILNRPHEQRLRKVYPDIFKWWFTDQCYASKAVKDLGVIRRSL